MWLLFDAAEIAELSHLSHVYHTTVTIFIICRLIIRLCIPFDTGVPSTSSETVRMLLQEAF